MKIIKKYGWTLYQNAVPVTVDTEVICSRGITYKVVGGNPPHKPSSSGRMFVDDGNGTRDYFPTVFDCRWVKDKDEDELQYIIWDIDLYAVDSEGEPLTNEDGTVRIFKPKYSVDMSGYIFDSTEVEDPTGDRL